jgi:ABC-2 type transport system permease protein
MLGSVLAKTLREQRGSLAWWAVGLVGLVVLTTAFYPSVRENAASLTQVIESLPGGLRRAIVGANVDFFSPAGYLQARLFSLLAPILLLVFAVGNGARAIAGEEERKTLDVLLATPTSRRRVFLDKAAAILAATAVLCTVLWATIAVTGPPFEVSTDLGRLAAAAFDCFLLATAFGGIALAVGAGSGRRGLAVGITTAVAAGSYLIDVLALSVGGIAWLQRLTPFYYYRASEPLVNGLDPLHVLVLGSLTLIAIALGMWAFDRRDLTT